MKKEVYLEIYNECNHNARKLIEAAQTLCSKRYFAQAYALAFTALEEISKGQFAADVFTGLKTEDSFRAFYRQHREKINNIGWAYCDASSYPYKYKWIGPDAEDTQEMNPATPSWDKRKLALYVDVDFSANTITTPREAVTEKDAYDIIHVADTALHRIWEITGEFGGMQIGTKGFMK
ncbi:MAG: AbiV family abortive infection protein [Candidatus Schekmanbacteria bacterium]|nr:MAG: AbiV family abortive infection protein [Candidatus Schekmanbacteria bacterium]